MELTVALFEWSTGRIGGPRLVGRIGDRDLVEAVRRRLAANHRVELARLEQPQPAEDEHLQDGEVS